MATAGAGSVVVSPNVDTLYTLAWLDLRDVWVLGRTRVAGEDDLAEARQAQRGPALEMLSAPTADPSPPLPRVQLAPNAPPEPRAAFFDELAAILASNPAPDHDAPVLARLAEVGVVPGATPSSILPICIAFPL